VAYATSTQKMLKSTVCLRFCFNTLGKLYGILVQKLVKCPRQLIKITAIQALPECIHTSSLRLNIRKTEDTWQTVLVLQILNIQGKWNSWKAQSKPC